MTMAGAKSPNLNEAASTWLERFHSGNWSEQDQADLDAWLAESSAHRVAYWRLEDAWSQASRLSALRPPRPQHGAPRRITSILARTAAVVVVCGALGALATNYLATPKTQTYATGLGGRESLALSDGSRIELNTNTSLRVATSGGQRTVWMDRGEAYFQIRHDAAHPFVVFANGHRITDMGTKFLVRQDKGRVEVALVEGRARVDAAGLSDKGRSAVLTPGEVAIATAGDLSVTQRPAQKLSSELDWRHDQITFSETTLGDAAAEFNRYNATKLVVTDPDIAKIKINGTFPTDGAEMFARVAQHIWQLRVTKRGDDIVISH